MARSYSIGINKNGSPRSWTSRLSTTRRKELVQSLVIRDGKNCWLCGDVMMFDAEYENTPLYRSIDHIRRPKNFKMTCDTRNMKLAHRDCNSRRHPGDD